MSTVTTKQNKSDTVFTKQYSYYHGSESNATTNMVGGISYKLSSDRVLDYSYNYNDTGNVENVYENGKKVAVYTYDELNQLVWYADTRTGRYIRIVYDNYGNIQRMESYSLGTNWAPVKLLETRTYSYGDTNWKDKLTEFDGDSITYDRNGNPLTYRDDMTFEWENGRILKNITTSDKAIQMNYDSNGMRTQKSVDGVKTNYYYDSSNNLFALTQGSDTLFFYYDNSGEVMSVSCNGTMYYYIKDLQGDITEIVDKDGKAVAEYAYDAWGNMLTENNGTLAVGKLNPFRYRSYVYDEETGLYYLQSRYYDPLTGRFVNADVYCDTYTGNPLSTNMFVYCENDAINYVDNDGRRTYFLNGINNNSKNGITWYASALKNKLSKYVKDVRIIAIYKSKKNGVRSTIKGVAQVFLEMMNVDVYTNSVVNIIKKDLKKKPLSKNEQLNIIGYSGGGQVALNVSVKLKNKITNVVLIGAPVAKIWRSKTKVSILYAAYDPLGWTIGFGFKSYFTGWYGHTDYFNKKNIGNVVNIIRRIIK